MANISHPPNGNGASIPPPKQKRARSQLSCTPCRAGKLKCNRAHSPACDQCIKRNREPACLYAPPPVKNKPVQNVKGRIRHLESLVVDLMRQQNQSRESESGHATASSGTGTDEGGAAGRYGEPTPPTSDGDPSPLDAVEREPDHSSPASSVERPFGQMSITKDEISYHGASHWKSILDSISNLKRDLGDEHVLDGDGSSQDSPEQAVAWQNFTIPVGTVSAETPSDASGGLGFMLGSSRRMTKEELIGELPDKRTADRLLSLWLNSPDPFKPIIHAPTFQQEYKNFWRDPVSTPPMWLGLLYAILGIAESFGLRTTHPDPTCLPRASKYHNLAAAAAVLADFTKPKQHTLECLLLYANGLVSTNAFVNVWLTTGLIVRLALRMGYHRDPSLYPTIPPFAAEMRRRVWAMLSMIDVLVSFQLGLPSMVRTIATDTSPPHNLLDRDFAPSSTVLPPSRPISELTPSSYTRAKVRLARIFAQAAELSHAIAPPPESEIQRLDGEVSAAHKAIPPLLNIANQDLSSPPEQLMSAFNLDLLTLKTRTVLHRRFMLDARSRDVCVDCALQVLRHHHAIYDASLPGGQLHSVRWYMASISTHDFLLAAMVLCLELSRQIDDDQQRPSKPSPSFRSCALNGISELGDRRAALVDALERSQRIWADDGGVGGVGGPGFAVGGAGSGGGETRKAGRAMGAMLARVRRHSSKTSAADGRWTSSSAGGGNENGVGNGAGNVNVNGDANRAYTAPDLSASGWDPLPLATDAQSSGLEAGANAVAGFGAGVESGDEYAILADMLSDPSAMDWSAWDSVALAEEREQAPFPAASAQGAWSGASGSAPVGREYGDGGGLFEGGAAGAFGIGWQDMQGVDLDFDLGGTLRGMGTSAARSEGPR